MEWWSDGVDGNKLRNKNRGYQQLRVWQDAIDLYVLSWRVFTEIPVRVEASGLASHLLLLIPSIATSLKAIAAARSGNISSSSTLPWVHWANRFRASMLIGRPSRLAEEDYKALNDLSFKLENGLLKLVESLERKARDWRLDRQSDHKRKQRSIRSDPPSITPPLHHSISL